MKTFEINDELEQKLETIQKELSLPTIKEAVSLGFHILGLIHAVEKEGGSLYIENNKGDKLPVRLKTNKEKEVKEPIKKKRKYTKKTTSKTKNEAEKPTGKIIR